jgi:8-oxo-dGTP pyrophosphatase MutT (NUDIX family)
MTTAATLCFIIRDGKVLLLHKSEGRFGGGKWNGLGGKLEEGETPADCARREVFEESGLRVGLLKHHGRLIFHVRGDEDGGWTVDVFSASEFTGEPEAGDEGVLRWFRTEDIPYGEMWQDDRHWLPLLLRGRRFSGGFYFESRWRELLRFDLAEESG